MQRCCCAGRPRCCHPPPHRTAAGTSTDLVASSPDSRCPRGNGRDGRALRGRTSSSRSTDARPGPSGAAARTSRLASRPGSTRAELPPQWQDPNKPRGRVAQSAGPRSGPRGARHWALRRVCHRDACKVRKISRDHATSNAHCGQRATEVCLVDHMGHLTVSGRSTSPARHRVLNRRAALDAVKALRFASPPRVVRAGPSGLDDACAPRGLGQYAVARRLWRLPVQGNRFQLRSG